jgi:hypothetical protein
MTKHLPHFCKEGDRDWIVQNACVLVDELVQFYQNDLMQIFLIDWRGHYEDSDLIPSQHSQAGCP